MPLNANCLRVLFQIVHMNDLMFDPININWVELFYYTQFLFYTILNYAKILNFTAVTVVTTISKGCLGTISKMQMFLNRLGVVITW